MGSLGRQLSCRLARLNREKERRIVSGAPGRIRTHDPLVRSQVLYPTELRARRIHDAKQLTVRRPSTLSALNVERGAIIETHTLDSNSRKEVPLDLAILLVMTDGPLGEGCGNLYRRPSGT